MRNHTLEVAPKTASPDALLNQREVAELLNVDVSWVKNHCTRTKPFLPHVRLGGGRYATRRFRRDHIEQFIDQNMRHASK